MSARDSKTNMVGVRELKTRLGRYLREVQRGRTIVITDRGEPVAELRPVSPAGPGSTGEIERLVPLRRLTRTSTRPLAAFRPIRLNEHSVAEAIVEDREDRF
jgi:prevent-host-death family protein